MELIETDTSMGPHQVRQSVTPDDARSLLANMVPQRRVSWNLVDQIADDITNGRFVHCYSPIMIDVEGRLFDGQQRCHAIIRADRPVDLSILYSVPIEAMKHVDRGRPRTAANDLQISGHSYASLLAAAARSVWSYQTAPNKVWTGSTASGLSSIRLVELVEEHPGWYSMDGIPGRQVFPMSKARILAAKVIIESRAASGQLFLDTLVVPAAEGANLPADSPQLALRNYVFRVAQETRHSGGWDAQSDIWVLIAAWNDVVEGKNRRMYKRPSVSRLPMPVPVTP